MIPLYTVHGVIITGQKRGRKLGYPTANISLTQDIPDGIYAATITIKGHTYLSATFVGMAKTFHEQDRKIESFIIDFNQKIYGENATIKLYKKIRDNKEFTTKEQLINQMSNDVEAVKSFFR